MVSKEHNSVKLLEALYLTYYSELKKYKGLCRDLKDFYFSKGYASDDYEFLTKEEYNEYLEEFYDLLNVIKDIRNSL